MKPILLALALSATVLSSPLPLPATRRVSGVVIKYTANYPDPPSPPLARADDSEAPEDNLNSELELPSATGPDLDNILSIERPLPSAFLLAVPALRAELEAESKRQELQLQLQQRHQQGMESKSGDNVARDSWSAGVGAVADASTRHACPVAALIAFSILSLLVCASQRWRKPRGQIYLHIDSTAQKSPSLRDGDEGSASDKNAVISG